MERYLENQFYENVNSPRWRDRLRGSLGFCHEHAWLAVDRRLGDALGFSIIYRDILNTVLKGFEEGDSPARTSRHWMALLRKVPEQTRTVMERMLRASTPARRCPVCEYREQSTREILSALVDGLKKQGVSDALHLSDGLCLPHLKRSLEEVKETAACERLLLIHGEKMQGLKLEMEEFIRKSDYQVHEGFGPEGDAWLRAVALVVGRRRK